MPAWVIRCVFLIRRSAFEGIARGINGKGELLVELADKSIANVYAGEVSVRGLNGYI